MKDQSKFRVIFIPVLIFLLQYNVTAQSYVLVGWNDLGMHCANKDFSKIAILPPFNNIYAQLIKKTPGQIPQVITSGVIVEYNIPGNTYSVGKTNFWTYAQQLFSLPQPLPDNIGLTGKGLTGTLDPEGNYYFARGIPITPFQDNNLDNESPFQLIHLVAKDQSSLQVLATTDVVIPVSNEVGCVQSGCHSSEQNILNEHEDAVLTAPVLCANCHADNALGTTGNPDLPSFSEVIHGKHSELGLPATTETCYKCHPGPNTQCFRDVMSQTTNPTIMCENCHGTLQIISQSINNGRQPWLQEPNCGDVLCHGSLYSEQPGKLFRESKGHGNLLCSACHSSPHAILPSREANDNLQNIALQGFAGTLQVCSVCHGDNPTSGGPHKNTTIVFEDNNITIHSFQLMQNYPNPFNPSTSIQYAIESRQFVTLKVFDVLGNEVATLVNEYKNAGSYEVEFKSSVGSQQLANGVYLYKLQAGDPSTGSGQNFVQTKKMILLK